MIESRSQTGHRRKMILSQSSAQSVASLPGAAETETKRIVPHRGSASGSDPPRSSPEAEPRLLMKNTTERKYSLVSAAFTVGLSILAVYDCVGFVKAVFTALGRKNCVR